MNKVMIVFLVSMSILSIVAILGICYHDTVIQTSQNIKYEVNYETN